VVVKALTPEPFDQLQSRLTKIFTKDPFETTDTFLARAADELNQRKRYMARSTAATYNITSASYNADLEQLTFKFMFTCRSGDQGEPCAPSYAIPLAQGPRSGVTGSTSETLSILKLLNPPPEYTRGFVLRVPADVAKEIVQGSPYVVVQFRLSVDLTVDTSIAQKVVPVENITIRTMSGWRYNYTYPEVAAAALDSVSLVSRTSGKVLATYDVP
jgi:hypothetical protein